MCSVVEIAGNKKVTIWMKQAAGFRRWLNRRPQGDFFAETVCRVIVACENHVAHKIFPVLLWQDE
jgi:hypothetical protein